MLTLRLLEAESKIDGEDYDKYLEQFQGIYNADGVPSFPQAIRPSAFFREAPIHAFDLYLRRPENESSELAHQETNLTGSWCAVLIFSKA